MFVPFKKKEALLHEDPIARVFNIQIRVEFGFPVFVFAEHKRRVMQLIVYFHKCFCNQSQIQRKRCLTLFVFDNARMDYAQKHELFNFHLEKLS